MVFKTKKKTVFRLTHDSRSGTAKITDLCYRPMRGILVGWRAINCNEWNS